MTDTESSAKPGFAKAPTRDEARSLPARDRGATYIVDDVVSVIGRLAAEQIEGVHAIGDTSFRQMVSRLGRHHGVDAEVGLQEAAVDIEIVVLYGHSIKRVAEDVRESIVESVESMTGRSMVEVNVFVIDVHVPEPSKRVHRRVV